MSVVTEESEEKDKALVQGLLDFKWRMDALIADAFAGNETFTQALRSGLELAINSRDNKPAELIGALLSTRHMTVVVRGLGILVGCRLLAPILHHFPALTAPLTCSPHRLCSAAKYMDLRLRGGPRAAGLASEEELEALLERAMFLFRCVHAKDVFEAFYKKDLSKVRRGDDDDDGFCPPLSLRPTQAPEPPQLVRPYVAAYFHSPFSVSSSVFISLSFVSRALAAPAVVPKRLQRAGACYGGQAEG